MLTLVGKWPKPFFEISPFLKGVISLGEWVGIGACAGESCRGAPRGGFGTALLDHASMRRQAAMAVSVAVLNPLGGRDSVLGATDSIG